MACEELLEVVRRHPDGLEHPGVRQVAKELGSTVPRVALAWVRSQPGVSSTIIGGRTLEQFEDNVQALELKLTVEQTKALDEVSAPQLPFPIPFLRGAPGVYAGGTTINGGSQRSHRSCRRDPATITDAPQPLRPGIENWKPKLAPNLNLTARQVGLEWSERIWIGWQ